MYAYSVNPATLNYDGRYVPNFDLMPHSSPVFTGIVRSSYGIHLLADVADAVDVPVILYNVPGRTGCSIPVETVARLARHPNICGIKEASGDISYAVKIARYLSDDFQMFCGNDDITLPLLSLGASGVISVWANIMPAACHQMVTDYLEGRREQALKAQLKYLDLINGLFTEVNPIPVKEAMNLMGMDVGGYRLPLCPMSSEHREKLAGIMRQAGLDVK